MTKSAQAMETRGEVTASLNYLVDTGDAPVNYPSQVWKLHRKKGGLTMLTYGPSLEPGPAVVVSAT